MTVNAGDTFFIPNPVKTLDSHLWTVISDPTIDSKRVVIVSFTTWKPDKDQACVVEAHEHPWLSRKSCIYYTRPQVVSVAVIDKVLQLPETRLHDPLSSQLLGRIRAAAVDSWLPLGVYDILEQQGVVPEF